jgi:hypothetical protein
VSEEPKMTDLDLDAIAARAEAATPRPWQYDGVPYLEDVEYGHIVIGGGVPGSMIEHQICWVGETLNLHAPEDATHIAGMDPTTTLALVAEVERLTEHVAAVDGMLAAAIDLAERSDAPDRVPTGVVRTVERLNRSALPTRRTEG